MCVCVCVCVGVCLWRSLCQNALMLKDTASILMHILGLPFKQYPSFSLILNTKQKREPKWKHITYENMCQQGNSYFRWNINETTYRNISYSKEIQHGKICTQKALNKQWIKTPPHSYSYSCYLEKHLHKKKNIEHKNLQDKIQSSFQCKKEQNKNKRTFK